MTTHRLTPTADEANRWLGGATSVLLEIVPQPIMLAPEEGSIYWKGEWGSLVGLSDKSPYSPGDVLWLAEEWWSDDRHRPLGIPGMTQRDSRWVRTVVSVEAVEVAELEDAAANALGYPSHLHWGGDAPSEAFTDWKRLHPDSPPAWLVEVAPE